VRLEIPTGQKASHRLTWNDPQLGYNGSLGSLDWSVVVLEEMTIDLEVSVQLSPASDGSENATPGLILLQETARGRTFRGTFDPSTDTRLAAAAAAGGNGEGPTVEAIIFEFDNAFSWMTAKEVELVALRVRPDGPPAALVPPLLPLSPLEVPPRSAGRHAGGADCRLAPGLAKPPPPGVVDEREEVLRFAARLDDWLAAAETSCPADGSSAAEVGGEWLKDLLARVASLRGLCKEASDKTAPPPGMDGNGLTAELLRAQDDRTSGAVIDFLKEDPAFRELARKELNDIIDRDKEDGDKLAAGIDQAVQKGVLPGDLEPPEYNQIDVMGKSADQVADEIIAKLPKQGGCVVVLVGLSGTGKGTTVDKIKQKIPNASTWSNGNCFRSLTLLAATWCEQQGMSGFDPSCLVAENLAAWADMLEFDCLGGEFDIRINGLDLDFRVSEVANTVLKEPRVSKNIPTVARETQGEVVKFAGDAVQKMGEAGTVVLLEGREQTLNFIPSPYRFCLTMSDTTVIGARRAAQRIAAAAVARIDAQGGNDVREAVRAALAELAANS